MAVDKNRLVENPMPNAPVDGERTVEGDPVEGRRTVVKTLLGATLAGGLITTGLVVADWETNSANGSNEFMAKIQLIDGGDYVEHQFNGFTTSDGQLHYQNFQLHCSDVQYMGGNLLSITPEYVAGILTGTINLRLLIPSNSALPRALDNGRRAFDSAASLKAFLNSPAVSQYVALHKRADGIFAVIAKELKRRGVHTDASERSIIVGKKKLLFSPKADGNGWGISSFEAAGGTVLSGTGAGPNDIDSVLKFIASQDRDDRPSPSTVAGAPQS